MRTPRVLIIVIVALLMGLPSSRVGLARPDAPPPIEINNAPGEVITVNAFGELIAADAPGEVTAAGAGSSPQAVAPGGGGGQLAAMRMSEGFENTWPAQGWELTDLSSTDGGEFLWGKRDCSVHTGLYGGWMVGGGAKGSTLPCGGNYPNNARVRALYGPFDLRGATSAQLTYNIKGRVEGGGITAEDCPNDYLIVTSILSPTAEFTGMSLCGDVTGGAAGNGYTLKGLNLDSRLGQPEVWIVFYFRSDSSVTDIGYTIDDIVLNVTTPTDEYTIDGTVRDGGGAPVANASVMATPVGGGSAITTQTAANGVYSLVVRTGTYIVQASKQGYQAGASQTITVPLSKVNVNFTLTLTPAKSTISGTVRNPDDTSAANVSVIASPVGNGVPSVVLTALDGTYTLSLDAGTYNLQAAKDGYAAAHAPSVTIPPSRTDVNMKLGALTQPATISGTVRDPDGAPAAGVAVTATLSGAGSSTTVQTSANGTYTLTLLPGTYDLQAAKGGYADGHAPSVTIPPSRTGIDMQLGALTQPATISGTVRDGGGAPLAGALVAATPVSGGGTVTAQSAADGSYSLSVSAGAYSIQATKQGYMAGQSISATVPPNRAGADFVLTKEPDNLIPRVYLPLIAISRP